MAKFLSSRLKNLNIGISSYTENERVLTATGDAFISGDLSVVGITTISGITYPVIDGSPNQILSTNGSGILQFVSASQLQGFNWNNNSDFGLITEAVITSDDSGSVAASVTSNYDLGTLVVSGIISPDIFTLPSYTVSTLPSALNQAGQMLFVTDETGGSIPAFSDGTNWRRVTDRQIVS